MEKLPRGFSLTNLNYKEPNKNCLKGLKCNKHTPIELWCDNCKKESNKKTKRKIVSYRDHCPNSHDNIHRLSDYSYWGCKHPKCDFCGYEDKTRTL